MRASGSTSVALGLPQKTEFYLSMISNDANMAILLYIFTSAAVRPKGIPYVSFRPVWNRKGALNCLRMCLKLSANSCNLMGIVLP